MKTDTLFYQLLQEFPQFFFELIGQPQTPLNAYQFIAPEVKQLSFRLDGLFTTTPDFENEPLYFVEAQFYKEEDFYDRLFSSIFLYFRQYRPANQDWYAIVIFDRRSHDCPLPLRYRELANSRLQRIYLDELRESDKVSIGLGIIQLIVEPPSQATELANKLINRARKELAQAKTIKQVLELIETIVIYKFPQLSRQEIEAMLKLEVIKETKVYQEARQEGIQEGKLEQKLATIPLLDELGLNSEQICNRLELDLETVRGILEKNQPLS